jgi:hypothetical protein
VQASTTAPQETGPEAGLHAEYWRFHDAVMRAQLTSWLPSPGRLLIDISGPDSPAATLAASAGHTVLHVMDPDAMRPGSARPDAGRLRAVAADGSGLQFLADGCADGLIAEDRALSRRLAAEALVSEIFRILRPGGRVLACVDSLTRGMAVLAEQHRWPQLVDLPHADVVLVPWQDGSITRCYGTEQLRELFTSGGFEVNWIRPRTVLSASTVGYLLARDPGSFRRLVEAELQTSADDSVGSQLVISASRPLFLGDTHQSPRPLPARAGRRTFDLRPAGSLTLRSGTPRAWPNRACARSLRSLRRAEPPAVGGASRTYQAAARGGLGCIYRRRRSRLDWQATHRVVVGRASRRPSGTGWPQSRHLP